MNALDEHIKRVVDALPPPTPEQIQRLRALLGYGTRAIDDPATLHRAGRIARGALDRKQAAEQERARRAEEEADRLAARRSIRRRRDPADVAVKILQEKIAAARSAVEVDPLTQSALRIMRQTGQSFADALTNARANEEAKRVHERQRERDHALGFHTWCVASQCPSAWADSEDDMNGGAS